MMTDSKPSPTIAFANIHWQDDKAPRSEQFGDVYFYLADGLEESRYVFIHHNRLAERWKQLNGDNDDNNSGDKSGHFIILETGFGTGLNFLATWQLWDQVAPSDWTLHFISIEKFPLQPSDLEKACSAWPELSIYAEQLINNYPAPTAGIHIISLKNPNSDGTVQLHLLMGDIQHWLPQLTQGSEQLLALHAPWAVDAWFLDGFAPSKNPDMWSNLLFQHMQRLSKANTTFATFTAASMVRRGLQEAGFQVNKAPGFGHKREMLTGFFPSS